MTEACGTMCCTLAQANNPLFSILEALHPHPSSGLHSLVLQDAHSCASFNVGNLITDG